MGYIIRTAADKASDEDLLSEMNALKERWEQIRKDYAAAPEETLVFEEASLFERAVRETMYEDVDEVVANDAMVVQNCREKSENPS